MEKQALIQLFGTSDIYLIIGGFVWGFLGIILGLILSVNKRNVKSSKSPEHFSWPFFWIGVDPHSGFGTGSHLTDVLLKDIGNHPY